jgi:flagellar hook-associated protein 1 FlgK
MPIPPLLGGGVQIDGIERHADFFLARQVASTLGEEAFASTRERVLLRLEQGLVDLNGNGIGDRISALYDSFSALATSPKDTAVRQEVISVAQRLVDEFHRAAQDLDSVASNADQELATEIGGTNKLAASVAQLNGEIAALQSAGIDASDLLDRRDLDLERLAELVGATHFEAADGQVSVLIRGQTLVQGGFAGHLEATPDVNLSGRNRIDMVSGSARYDLTSTLGGKLGGLVDVRDVAVPAFRADLDQLAFDLVAQINTQHLAGFGLDGVNNRTLFDAIAAPAGAAAAIALRSDLTADQLAASGTATGVPGNNQNALLLAALRQTDLAATGGRASERVASFVARVGGESAGAIADASVRGDELATLKTLRESVSGVSTDEEMARLIEYQRSYQASARVMRTVDQLLAELVRM